MDKERKNPVCAESIALAVIYWMLGAAFAAVGTAIKTKYQDYQFGIAVFLRILRQLTLEYMDVYIFVREKLINIVLKARRRMGER